MPPLSTPLSPLAAVLAGRAAPARLASTPALSPALVPPPQPQRPDLTHAGGETPQELLAGFKQASIGYRNAVVAMAHFGHRLHELNDWEQVGYRNEEEFCLAQGLSATTWENCLLLGARLSHLSLEEMRELTVAAAQLLARIPQKLWEEYAWVEEARLMPLRDFAQMVKQRGAAAKEGLREPKAALSLSVPATLRDQLERRIDSIRHLHRLTSPAATLDFVLRAAEHGPEVITTTEKLDQCVGELERLQEEPADDHAAAEALLRRLRRHVKELKRYAIGLSTEVQEDLAPGASHAPGR